MLHFGPVAVGTHRGVFSGICCGFRGWLHGSRRIEVCEYNEVLEDFRVGMEMYAALAVV